MGIKGYNFILFLLLPFIILLFILRVFLGKEDKNRFLEKFSFPSKNRPIGKIIWFHACSVGEVKSSYNLIRFFIKNNYSVLVTTNTYLSSLDVKKNFSNKVIHQYLPLDLKFFIKRFLNHWKPDKAVFIESELWPNLIFGAKKLNIPLCLIQARVSDNSLRKWIFFKNFFINILNSFTFIIPQSTSDKKKLENYTHSKISSAINLKYTSEKLKYSKKDRLNIKNNILKKNIISAASTHSGEEEIIINQVCKLKNIKKNLLVIQPRHPARNKKIIKLIKKYNLTYKQRSKGELPNNNTNIYLFDTFGESGLLISISDLIIIGGTLVSVGGHNLLESAQFGKNIIVGPYTQKIKEVVGYFKKNNAIETLTNNNELYKYIEKIISDKKYSSKLSYNARKLTSRFSNAELNIYKRIGLL